jgi:hypothetical protein
MQFRHGPFDILWMGGLGFLSGQTIFFARFVDQNIFSNILYTGTFYWQNSFFQ